MLSAEEAKSLMVFKQDRSATVRSLVNYIESRIKQAASQRRTHLEDPHAGLRLAYSVADLEEAYQEVRQAGYLVSPDKFNGVNATIVVRWA